MKNVFGHRSVKENVGEIFNHAADFIKFVTYGYVLLAAMHLCGMESLGDHLSNAPQDGDDDTFLKDVAGRVVQLIWHDPRVDKILASDEENENKNTYWLYKTGKLPCRYGGI